MFDSFCFVKKTFVGNLITGYGKDFRDSFVSNHPHFCAYFLAVTRLVTLHGQKTL